MNLEKLRVEMINSIKELELPIHIELSANIEVANFIYLLQCFVKDKVAQNSNSMQSDKKPTHKKEEI